MIQISFDTETTGLDLRHGALPFFATSCDSSGRVSYWEWAVDPLSRSPLIPPEDREGVRLLLLSADRLILQNAKFDVAAFAAAGVLRPEEWPWKKTVDTLLAGHLLASNHPHDLTSMALEYLHVDIERYEKSLEQATQEARRHCRTNLPEWRIAKAGLPEMPSAREKTWKFDTWLPAAVANRLGHPDGSVEVVNCRTDPCDVRITRPSKWGNPFTHLPLEHTQAQYRVSSPIEAVAKYRLWIEEQPHLLEAIESGELDGKRLGCVCKPPKMCSPGASSDPPCHGDVLAEKVRARRHPWYDVLSAYANKDAEVTYLLWTVMEGLLRRRNLTRIYEERIKVLPTAFWMEERGVTVSKERLDWLKSRYREESAARGRECVSVAANYEVECPECKKEQELVETDPVEAAMLSVLHPNAEHPTHVYRGDGLLPFPAPVDLDGMSPCTRCDGKRKVPYPLELPKSGNCKSLLDFVFKVMKIPVVALTDKGNPSLDKNALEAYVATLPPKSFPHRFVTALRGKRKRDTAISYLEGYERFWVPLGVYDEKGEQLWYRLHPFLNPTGTDTLRWSSSQPNEQNISKQGMDEGDKYSLRYCFGPAPGREWWSLDARGIEDRLPAYESRQQELIDIFERPDDPPYYGSNHFLRFHTVYPDIWDAVAREVGADKAGPTIKKRYNYTYYQWVKNGGFAVQYGAVDRDDGEGTADRAFHKKGAQAMLKSRFSKLESLNQYWIRFAAKHGYVETIPDKTVDPARGYPILCSRTERGGIKPTVPLNYHIQSSAMWWMMKAMIRVSGFFDALNSGERFAGRRWPGGYHLALQVHDELVPDMPSGKGKGPNPHDYNLPVAREVQRLMTLGGDDFGIPTPVTLEYHELSWNEGISL